MILVFWFFVLCSDPIYLQDYYVQPSNEGFSWLALAEAKANRRNSDHEAMSIWADGALVKDEQWFALNFKDGERQALKSPPAEPMSYVFPYMSEPCFFQLDSLYVWRKSAWLVYKVPIWYEIRERRPVPGSSHGLTPIFPQVVGLEDGRTLVYQEKTGKMLIINAEFSAHKQETIPEKLKVYPLAGHLFWMNAPKKGRFALADQSQPYDLLHTMSVADLNRYSPVILTGKGLWVLTFSDSFGDVLDSWDSGKVVVKAHYLKTIGKRLSRKSFKLPELPVDFELNTSSSGSPKIGVDPNFSLYWVRGSEALAVRIKQQLLVVDPNQGSQGPFKLPEFDEPLVNVTSQSGVLRFQTPGSVHSLERGGP